MVVHFPLAYANHPPAVGGSVDRLVIASQIVPVRQPVYSVLLTFVIALLLGAIITALLYWRTRDEFWAQRSYWLIWAGMIAAVLSALAGMWDPGAYALLASAPL